MDSFLLSMYDSLNFIPPKNAFLSTRGKKNIAWRSSLERFYPNRFDPESSLDWNSNHDDEAVTYPTFSRNTGGKDENMDDYVPTYFRHRNLRVR